MSFIEVPIFKGYTSQKSPLATPIDYFRSMVNALIEDGELIKRKAFKELKNPNKSTIDGFREYFFASTRSIILKQKFTPFEWYTYKGSSLATVTNWGATTGAAQFPPSFAEFGGVIYTCENSTTCRKLATISATETFERMGVPRPSASYATTAVVVGTAISTVAWEVGNHFYALTFVVPFDQGEVESDAIFIGSYNMAVPGATNVPRIQVTPTTAALANIHSVSKARIYRKNPSQNEYYFVKELAVSNGVLAQWDDDASGTGAPTAQDTGRLGPITHGYPEYQFRSIAIFKSRLFGIDSTSRLWVSEVGKPDYIQARSYLQVGDPSEYGMKLIVYGDTLLIVKRNSIWALTGNSWADFTLQPVLDIGAVSIYSVFIFNNSLYFVNEQGLWRWLIGQGKPELISVGIQKDFELTAQIDLDRSVVGLEPTKGDIWVSFASSKIYVFDPTNNIWKGVISLSHTVECFNYVGNYAGYSKKAAIFFNGKLNSYNEDSGISGTAETSMAFSARTGMKLDRSAIQKIYKNLVMFDRENLNYTTTNTQTLSVAIDFLNSTVATVVKTVTVNQNSYNIVDIGRTDRGMSIEWKNDAINIDPVFSIIGFELEYELVGVRR